jgi:hypothetical protein
MARKDVAPWRLRVQQHRQDEWNDDEWGHADEHELKRVDQRVPELGKLDRATREEVDVIRKPNELGAAGRR